MSSSWPIIVGGCHRSGTTLLRRLLDAHSCIYCGPEVTFFRDFYGDFFYDPLKRERFATTARSILSESDLFELLGQAFVEMHRRAAAQAGKLRWADKLPDNVLYWQAWEQLLGAEWVLVHIVRNPFDTLASFKEVKFDFALPLTLGARILFWKRYTEAGLAFGARHPERYYQVIYEELVSEPEIALSRLMSRLDEQFERTQLAFNRAPHAEGLEDGKARESTSIYITSVGRWAVAFSPAEAEQIAEACIPLWKQIDPEGKWVQPYRLPTDPPPASAVEPGQAATAISPPLDAAKPSVGALSQLSSELSQQTFELETQRVAIERWNQELLKEIALRDQEIARLTNFLPLRVARAIKRTFARQLP